MAAPIPVSEFSKRVHNPIRAIVENIRMPKDPKKPLIPLSIGDPTVFGNLNAPQVMVDKVVEGLKDKTCNGYVHSAGTVEARKAIAAASSTDCGAVTENDVVIASGCSGALDLAISALLNPGDNILLPCPGFALYQTLAESYGATCKFYNLLPEASWQADVAHLESLIDDRTRVILVNNPSNPCGSVFPEEHLRELLAVAERHGLPVLADEIYGDMVFEGHRFTPMASLTDTVPVIATSGLAKQYLVPGWRVGWVVIHDRGDRLSNVRKALFSLSQMTLGANAIVQHAIPSVLQPKAGSEEEEAMARFSRETRQQLQDNAAFTTERLGSVPGIEVIVPQGAMYVMCKVDVEALDGVADDMDFTQKLLDEESVFVLPGRCFGVDNYFRIVFTAPKDKLTEAYARIEAFCARHRK